MEENLVVSSGSAEFRHASSYSTLKGTGSDAMHHHRSGCYGSTFYLQRSSYDDASPQYQSALSTGLPDAGVKVLTEYSSQTPQPGDLDDDGEDALDTGMMGPVITSSNGCPKDVSALTGRTVVARQQRNEQQHHPSQWQTAYDANEAQRAHCVFSAYLQGQLANVAKAAIWWSTFGVVAEALTGLTLAVGTTRLVFNLALVLLSPLAGAVAEKANIYALLSTTTWGRSVVWCVLIPLAWVVLGVAVPWPVAFYVAFLVFMFLDGAQVSFANVVDIDCGGLDALAQQYRLSIGNFIRDRFNRFHQIVFDLSFIILTPPLAFFIWQLALYLQTSCVFVTRHASSPWDDATTGLHVALRRLQFPILTTTVALTQQEEHALRTSNTPLVLDTPLSSATLCGKGDVGVLLAGICSIFGGLSLFSLWSYRRFRSQHVASTAPSEASHETSLVDDRSPRVVSLGHRSHWVVSRERFRDIKDGFLIVLREPVLGWRLMFLALETALEDAVVSVVIPQVALRLSPLVLQRWRSPQDEALLTPPVVVLPGGWTFINFVAVSLIAVGKAGGLLAASYMNSRWTVPTTLSANGPYLVLFRCMFVSCSSLLLLPLTYYLLLHPHLMARALEAVVSLETAVLITLTSVSALAVIGKVTVDTSYRVAAIFMFFVFSAAPKIGFATLLHNLVLQHDIDTKVFGFVGTCVTVTDAVVILAINLIFACFGTVNFLVALCATAAVYALHGICELFLAPGLILRGNAEEADVADFPNLARYGDSGASPRRLYVDGGSTATEWHSIRYTNGWDHSQDQQQQQPQPNQRLGEPRSSFAPMEALQSLVERPSTHPSEQPPRQHQSTAKQIGSWADAKESDV